MIISRTPFRLSFVGGGSDIEEFYRQYPGQVLSTTINHYIYLAVKRRFEPRIRVAYSVNEDVESVEEMKHTRVKAALEHFGIGKGGFEIVSMADLPARTGLGSSSSFTVGLVNSLSHFLRRPLSEREMAETACTIEIKKVGEPIGKQDQYAAAFGGFNIFKFMPNGAVEVQPLYLTPAVKKNFENHLLFFFTGKHRDTGSVLMEQKANLSQENKFQALKKMADLVPTFRQALEKNDMAKTGMLLHENWLLKKSLASQISDPSIDGLYEAGRTAGAWGGKILGAGGGGFLMFIAAPEKHEDIRKALSGLRSVQFGFSEGGSKVIYDDERQI